MEPSDGELVGLARAGDSQALAVLLARHRAAMHAVVVARLGCVPDAEDVVQDATLVAIAGLHRLHDPATARAWLTGITRNLCRERARVRHPVTLDAHPADSRPLADGSLGPQDRLERNAVRDWIWSALNALSEPLHDAVLLRYFSQARSYDAIALALGVPVGTVRSRLNAARAILAGEIQRLAGAAHPDHIARERDRVALFAGITAEYNGGRNLDLLRDVLLPDARLTAADGQDSVVGREPIVRSIAEDLAAGVRLRLLNVIAGRNLTVVEGAFDNPQGDPDHCPPLTTQVMFHNGAGIAAMHLHYGGV